MSFSLIDPEFCALCDLISACLNSHFHHSDIFTQGFACINKTFLHLGYLGYFASTAQTALTTRFKVLIIFYRLTTLSVISKLLVFVAALSFC